MDDDYITDIIRRYEADLQNVKQNGWLIEIVKDQTYELCLEAVKKNWRALQFVKEQTPKFCLAAVKEHGFSIG